MTLSLYDYLEGRKISEQDPPFAALIQAAMRKADTDNLEKLRREWPDIWNELQLRYNAPGAVIPDDTIDYWPGVSPGVSDERVKF